MTHSSRRNFLQKTAVLTLGTVAAAGGVSFGKSAAGTTLQSTDPELASIVQCYGRVSRMQDGGYRKVRAGSGQKLLPVTRVQVRVRDRKSFQHSFQKLANTSDRVHVEKNTTSMVRDGRYFVIENQLA